jgi:hypothetical protein
MSSNQEEFLKKFDKLISEGNELPLENYSNNDHELRANYKHGRRIA